MNLKEFVSETLRSVSEAVAESAESLREIGIDVNPPMRPGDPSTLREDTAHTYRRVEAVDFDVAVTATQEVKGSAKGGIKVLSIGADAEAGGTRSTEAVSRVQFTVPIAFPTGPLTETNLEHLRERHQKLRDRRASPPSNWLNR